LITETVKATTILSS